jgi:hypothetical protein
MGVLTPKARQGARHLSYSVLEYLGQLFGFPSWRIEHRRNRTTELALILFPEFDGQPSLMSAKQHRRIDRGSPSGFVGGKYVP